MTFLRKLSLEELTPARLWSELDSETRRSAARSLYREQAGRREGDAAIASRLRFREDAVRRLPVEKRVGYLSDTVRPDDSLASSLLVALHVALRRPLLVSFLDGLGIPHRDGIIEEEFEPPRPERERLERAADRLYADFPESEVELYLASLVAMDPELWGDLVEVVRDRG